MSEKKKKKRDKDNRDGEKKYRSSKQGAHGDRDAKMHKSKKDR